jgi:hypothetical protein
MAKEVGLIFQQVPKGLADAVDHYAALWDLSAEQMIRAALTCLHMKIEARDDDTVAFMQRVSEEAKRERDRALVLIGSDRSV